MKRFAIAAALAAVGLVSSAHAATVYNTNVVSWNVGSGQSNGNFVVSTENSIELGLRAQVRFAGPIDDNDLDGIYHALPGISSGVDNAKWNFDFSANLAQAPQGSTLTLRIDTDPSAAKNFIDVDAFLLRVPETTTGLVQGSQNMGFFAPANFAFNPFIAGIYDYELIAKDSAGGLLGSVAMTVNVIPLPAASLAGFALFGVMGLRRRA